MFNYIYYRVSQIIYTNIAIYLLCTYISRGESEKGLSVSLLIYTKTLFALTPRFVLLVQPFYIFLNIRDSTVFYLSFFIIYGNLLKYIADTAQILQ